MSVSHLKHVTASRGCWAEVLELRQTAEVHTCHLVQDIRHRRL